MASKQLLTQSKGIERFQGSLILAKEIGIREAFIFEKLNFIKRNFNKKSKIKSERFYVSKESLMETFNININQLNFSLRKLINKGYLKSHLVIDYEREERRTLFSIIRYPPKIPYINASFIIASLYGIDASIVLSFIESRGLKWSQGNDGFEFKLQISEIMNMTSLSRKRVFKAIEVLEEGEEGEEGLIKFIEGKSKINPNFRYFRLNIYKLRVLMENELYNLKSELQSVKEKLGRE